MKHILALVLSMLHPVASSVYAETGNRPTVPRLVLQITVVRSITFGCSRSPRRVGLLMMPSSIAKHYLKGFPRHNRIVPIPHRSIMRQAHK